MTDNIATVRGKNKSKQLPWFRFYTEALDDPKVQRLPPHLFKTWVNLLCIAGKNNGKLPSIDDIAFKLRLSSQDAEQQLSELILAGLIDITDEGRSPHNWAARQYVSDCSTERVRKYREKKAETQCNVSVTASETAPEQIQNRTDPEDAQAREPGGQVDRQWAEAYCRGIDIKGGKTAKSARAQLRTKGELDGSTGITLENGKLSVTNGSSAALASEFPGIDLAAVCNRAAPELMRQNYPTHDDAMAVLRKWAQIAQETASKPTQKAAEPDFAAMTKGTVRHAKPAPGSVMFPEVH
jgi:hypothetical protein